eukprot:Skav202203  [mRNA]  locus=scaffold2207:68295:96968:- [translate_table: standard]
MSAIRAFWKPSSQHNALGIKGLGYGLQQWITISALLEVLTQRIPQAPLLPEASPLGGLTCPLGPGASPTLTTPQRGGANISPKGFGETTPFSAASNKLGALGVPSAWSKPSTVHSSVSKLSTATGEGLIPGLVDGQRLSSVKPSVVPTSGGKVVVSLRKEVPQGFWDRLAIFLVNGPVQKRLTPTGVKKGKKLCVEVPFGMESGDYDVRLAFGEKIIHGAIPLAVRDGDGEAVDKLLQQFELGQERLFDPFNVRGNAGLGDLVGDPLTRKHMENLAQKGWSPIEDGAAKEETESQESARIIAKKNFGAIIERQTTTFFDEALKEDMFRDPGKNHWKPFFFPWHSATARGQSEHLMDRTASAESTGSTSSPFAQGVKVVASTWARDSHDLFDFEASQLQTKSFNVPNSAKFVRSGTDVQMFTDNENPPAGGEPMLRLVQREGSYWVDKATPASSSKKLWVVVRDLASSGHRLSEGDVIKPEPQCEDRLEDAEQFLKQRSSTWAKEAVKALHPFLYTHCWWHLALLHCERGNFDDCLAIFDEPWMLWRLELRQVSVLPRWQRVLEGCRGLSLPKDGTKIWALQSQWGCLGGSVEQRGILLEVRYHIVGCVYLKLSHSL